MTAVVKWSVRVVSLSLSLTHTQDGSFVRVWDGERGREEGDMAPLDRFWETLDFKCSVASIPCCSTGYLALLSINKTRRYIRYLIGVAFSVFILR